MEIDFTFCKYDKNSSAIYESQKWIYYLTNIFEIVELSGNILSIILITLIILCRKTYLKTRNDAGISLIKRKTVTFKKYWWHTLRNILLLNLIAVRCLSFGETLIRRYYSVDSSILWINIFGSVFSLICVILIQVYLEYLEKLAAHQLYLLLPLFLWCFHVSSAIARFYEIAFRYCVSVIAVAPSLQLVIVAETISLIIIDVATIVRWVTFDRRKQSLIVNSHREEKAAITDKKRKPENIQNTKPPNLNQPKICNFGTFRFRSSPSSSTPSTNNTVEYIPSGESSEDLETNDGFAEEDNAKDGKLRYCHTDISFLSKFTHKWYLKILRRGWQNPLEFSDLDSVPTEYATMNQYENLQKNCELIKGARDGFISLWKAFLSTYWKPIFYAGILKFFGDIINVVGPLVIAPIVRFVKSVQEGTWELHGEMHYEVYFVGWSEFVLNGWILCFLAFVASILQSTFSQESTNILTTEGIRVRTALQAKIYDKTLKVSVAVTNRPKENYNDSTTTNVHSLDAARVINLSTEDTENVMRFFMHCHYLWAIPFKVSFLVALLYLQMGISAFYATGISVLFLVPLQFVLGKSIKKVNHKILETCDERLVKTNELITCIRTLKMMALEELFLERVSAARKEELQYLLKDGMLRALLTFLTQASGIMIILLAFSFYSLLQDKLPEEGVIFSSLSLFSQLTVALFLLPSIVQHTTKAVGSVKRLQEFFAEPEVKPKPEVTDTIHTASGQNISDPGDENIITIKDADFAYGEFVDDIVLKNISTTLQKGKLTMVIGGVGSGKSSFLLSLLGEVNKLSGSIHWSSKSNIAYVSQTPWLLNATLRENILIGRGFQTKKYKRVLGICALQPDIDLLPDGDSTEIGERGVNLSGGQKARVSLARALYSELPLLILDCPFSALDASVACQVFQQIVNYHNKKALKSTIVLATQHYRLCTSADKVIYLENMGITFEGEPQDILKSCPDLLDKLALQLCKYTPPDSSLQNTDTSEMILPRHYINRISRRSRFSSHLGQVPEVDTSFMGSPPIRSFSLLRSSPLHAVLPSDELEAFSDQPLLRRRKSRLPKDSLFRTTSSSPAFERFEDDLREKSHFQRRHAKSLPSRPTTSKQAGRDNSITKKELKRKESIIRKLFPTQSNSRRRSQKMERRQTNTNIWSVLFRKGLQIPEEDETDSVEEDSEDSEDSDSIVCKAFINEEERERGKISKWNYVAYLKACGFVLGSFYIVFMIANQGLLITLDIWLGHWSKMCQEENCTTTMSKNCPKNASRPSNDFNKTESELSCLEVEETVGSSYILVFGLLSGFAISVGFFSICLNQLAAHRGRRVLHDKMLRGIVGTQVRFFDLTPVGTILNRFSRDMSLIDKDIGWSVMHFFYFALLCFSAILVNSVVSPIFILVSIPLCVMYYVVQHVFRCSARELKRLESLSLSPVLTLITETAYFPPVIRAYGLQFRFFSCFCRRVDSYLSSSFLFHAGNRWLGITLDYMGCLIVFMSTLACLIGSTTGMTTLLPPMAVGLAIKYTLTIPVYLNWLVRYFSSTEVCLNSVERVLQYTRLAPEAEIELVECCAKRKCKCSKSFKRRMNSVLKYDMEKHLLKRQDHIVFENVDLYYDKEAQPVVSQVSLKIPTGQKVGICGRTGSGKSSLVMGLMRMTDRQEGRILFNGFDIKKLPHSILRKQIAVVSQDVCIFKDTLRFNVDLESKFTDEEIWAALEKVHLKETMSSLPKKLDTIVGSGNLVLSAGQSQLLVLSRILLDRRNLVILDEFAAAMDSHLESQLLSMIKTELSNSTIIMVTHNTSSLLSCDRILSINEGKLIEDGSPTELQNQPEGIFLSLLRASNH